MFPLTDDTPPFDDHSGEKPSPKRRFGPKAERPKVEVVTKPSTKPAGARTVPVHGPGPRVGATIAPRKAGAKRLPQAENPLSPPPDRSDLARLKPGLAARIIAADVAEAVYSGQMLDIVLEWQTISAMMAILEPRDRALTRALASATLRHRGEIDEALARFIQKPLPKEAARLKAILSVAVAQLLFMDVPDHAAVSLAMDCLDREKQLHPWKALANAVMRRIGREREQILATQDIVGLTLPQWLLERWDEAYGNFTVNDMVKAILREPALDLTVKSDPEGWAERLGGIVLPTGSVRLVAHGPVQDLPGFTDGEWWVQDAAAALPVKLFGDVAGKSVADLCAAPGGKTAMLAHLGAEVTAVDASEKRLQRVRENLGRLKLKATLVAGDAATWMGPAFDAILLDAPCTATGTLRRHPDVALNRTPKDVMEMAATQRRLLDHAIRMLKPGGILVFSTCSLEPEEGPEQIRRLLQIGAPVERVPILPEEIGGRAELITEEGDLRTLPSHFPHEDLRLAGLDGFYAARLRRI